MKTDTKNIQARVPAELHTWVRVQALKEDTTVNELVQRLVEDYRKSLEEPSGEFCSCSDEDCVGDHR